MQPAPLLCLALRLLHWDALRDPEKRQWQSEGRLEHSSDHSIVANEMNEWKDKNKTRQNRVWHTCRITVHASSVVFTSMYFKYFPSNNWMHSINDIDDEPLTSATKGSLSWSSTLSDPREYTTLCIWASTQKQWWCPARIFVQLIIATHTQHKIKVCVCVCVRACVCVADWFFFLARALFLFSRNNDFLSSPKASTVLLLIF